MAVKKMRVYIYIYIYICWQSLRYRKVALIYYLTKAGRLRSFAGPGECRLAKSFKMGFIILQFR